MAHRYDVNLRNLERALVFGALVAVPLCSKGYNTDVHERMTDFAYSSSRLANDPSVLIDLGIDPSKPFVDSQGNPGSIREVIAKGAVYEDYNGRPANHFFDPISGAGLSVGMASPLWALLKGSQPLPYTPFSYEDARQYEYDAMTLVSPTDRDAKTSLMFEALGHVVHHIQDMAQPQHARLDRHLDWKVFDVPLGSPSGYERWTSMAQGSGVLDYSSYPKVYAGAGLTDFSSPASFWSTGIGANGLGIAEYTNRGFISAGTNFSFFAPPKFPQPALNPVLSSVEDIQQLCDKSVWGCESPVTGSVTFFANYVEDSYHPELSDFNYRMTTLSLFSDDLKKRGYGPVYSVNQFTYEAAQAFLIPRAVAYSTGMIDYFFRPRIDMIEDPDQIGVYKLRNLGQEPINGRFELYYDAQDGNRYPVALDASWNGVSIDAGKDLTGFTFTPPTPTDPSLFPKDAGKYILVFSGTMGNEFPEKGAPGAVAAKVVQLEAFQAYSARVGVAFSNGPSGVVQLYVHVPPSREAEWQAGLSSSVVQFDGYIIPNFGGVTQTSYGVRATGQTGAIDGLFEWDLWMMPNNKVVYGDGRGGYAVSDDRFASYYASIGFLPAYANELDALVFHDPCSTHTMELFFGSKPIFSFKFRLENDPLSGQIHMVLWEGKDIFVVSGAYQIAPGAEASIVSCPI